MIIRFMTYNVHRCIGRDKRADFKRIATVIETYRPDVVALQELDVNVERSDRIDQPHQIARYLNMHYHFYASMQVQGGDYGNAIFSTLPITMVKAGKIPNSFITKEWTLLERILKPSFETRGALWVSIDVNGTPVQVVNTHMGLTYQDRKVQVERLLSSEWLNHPDCREPVVFMGDINDSHRSRIVRRVTREFRDVQNEFTNKRHKTFFSHLPLRCIDHIFLKGPLRVTDYQAPRTSLTKMASDHLPLIADIEV